MFEIDVEIHFKPENCLDREIELKYIPFPENKDVKVLQIDFYVTDSSKFFKEKLKTSKKEG